jgi:hypothetical protein
MLLRGAVILVAAWGISSPRLPARISLDGTAQLCPEDDAKGDTAGVPGIHVYAFDAARVPKIRASLAALDTISWSGDGVEAMHAFTAEYAELITVLKQTPALGAARSNVKGDFRLTMQRADSVLLFAEQELEDEPFFFASKVVPIRNQTQVRVVLPMCNKRV